MWINVLNPDLSSFKYADYGMTKERQVTDSGKVQVPDDVGEALLDHPSGHFEKADGDNE